jgi:hypothetical protein
MKKVTTTDLLKDVLVQRGGNIDDWKRVSRKKDAVGRIVREFQNKATGQVLEIVEVSKKEHLVYDKTPGLTSPSETTAANAGPKP